jgi:hypothetical protein
LRSFGERSDLLFAVSGFVVFDSFVNVLLPVLDEPVEQAGNFCLQPPFLAASSV